MPKVKIFRPDPVTGEMKEISPDEYREFYSRRAAKLGRPAVQYGLWDDLTQSWAGGPVDSIEELAALPKGPTCYAVRVGRHDNPVKLNSREARAYKALVTKAVHSTSE